MSGGPIPVWQKYTTRSKGIWERLRQVLTLVPNRSSGNPVVLHYRLPPPGSRIADAKAYADPMTMPTGDIAGNPYFKRDHRRHYPQIHSITQTRIAGLLQLGSAAAPRIAKGEEGSQALLLYTGEDDVCLASALESMPAQVLHGQVLSMTGGPVTAPSLNKFHWRIVGEPESGMFADHYPCRIFTDIKAQS